MGTPQSLILVTVDCFRADHAGFLGYRQNTTPFLNSLAESSTIFTNAIVAGAPTYYSFPAIMASRHPLALGRDVVGVAPEEPTIASTLRQQGYSTAAFLAANPYLSGRFGYDVGFDTFRDFLEADAGSPPDLISDSADASRRNRLNSYLAKTCHAFKPAGKVYDELYFHYCQTIARRGRPSLDSLRRFPSADVIVNESLAWLENFGTEPFFLWLHLMDPHSPYYPKEEALAWMASDSDCNGALNANSYWNRQDIGAQRLRRRVNDVVGLYDAGIRWVDAQIARLVEHLRHRKLWDSCVFALTADHGEEFLDHGGRYHPPRKLTEELIRVPLLLCGAKASGKNVHTAPFSLIDLAPTLLDAMNIPAPRTFRGTSLWDPSRRNNTAIAEAVSTCKNPFDSEQRVGPRILAVREQEFKLVLDFALSRETLFNLHTDPGELHPLAVGAEKPVRRRLLQCAKDHIGQSVESRNPELRLDSVLRALRLECGEFASNVSA